MIKSRSSNTHQRMRTIMWWFSKIKDADIRDRAKANATKQKRKSLKELYGVIEPNFQRSLLVAFDWSRTPEGDAYWRRLYWHPPETI